MNDEEAVAVGRGKVVVDCDLDLIGLEQGEDGVHAVFTVDLDPDPLTSRSLKAELLRFVKRFDARFDRHAVRQVVCRGVKIDGGGFLLWFGLDLLGRLRLLLRLSFGGRLFGRLLLLSCLALLLSGRGLRLFARLGFARRLFVRLNRFRLLLAGLYLLDLGEFVIAAGRGRDEQRRNGDD